MRSPVYAITALRWQHGRIIEAMVGLIDPSESSARWDLQPTPVRVGELVDRLAEGDVMITLFPGKAGGVELGPEVKVDVLPSGVETLVLAEEAPGRSLEDLPKF